jgi:hypothetical protein
MKDFFIKAILPQPKNPAWNVGQATKIYSHFGVRFLGGGVIFTRFL